MTDLEQQLVEEEKLKEKARKISVLEGSSTSLMEGFGNRYISAYAIALNSSNTAIALLSSLPALLANISQLFTLRLLKTKQRRKIVIPAVFLQAFLWLPLIALGYSYFFLGISAKIASILLILTYSLILVAGGLTGPAWSSWMRDIVPPKILGQYFGKRSRICGIIALIGSLIAGGILDSFGIGKIFYAFAILFLISFLGRFFSGVLYTQKYEPKFVYKHETYFSFKQFIQKMCYNNFGRFVLFISLISLATAIAAPFFAVYMLKNLHLSYLSFTIITLCSPLANLFFVPIWGKFADKYGNIKILRLTGWFIPLVPFLWLISAFIFSNSSPYLIPFLIIVELFSGCVWSGFNLGAANFVYEAVTRERMPFCVAYFNIINAAGTFVGALIGGFFASTTIIIFGLSSILLVFAISTLARISLFLILSPMFHEVRDVCEFNLDDHIKEKFKDTLEESSSYLADLLGFKPIKINGSN